MHARRIDAFDDRIVYRRAHGGRINRARKQRR
jgi:hypothetical protein